jgi:hypothetical protein
LLHSRARRNILIGLSVWNCSIQKSVVPRKGLGHPARETLFLLEF